MPMIERSLLWGFAASAGTVAAGVASGIVAPLVAPVAVVGGTAFCLVTGVHYGGAEIERAAEETARIAREAAAEAARMAANAAEEAARMAREAARRAENDAMGTLMVAGGFAGCLGTGAYRHYLKINNMPRGRITDTAEVAALVVSVATAGSGLYKLTH